MEYLKALGRAVAGPGWAWWISLLFTYFIVGAGAYPNYPAIRDFINRWVALMPEQFPAWLVVIPFLLWVIARLAHREAMARLRAGRIIFEEPYISSGVNMFARDGSGRILGQNDIAKIQVRNCPYDGANGQCIRDAFASITFYDKATQRIVLEVDYPRWQQNPKPGYHVNPVDHIPDEWNRRDLRPSGERSTLNFLVKSRSEGAGYGFRTASQIRHPLWHEAELELAPGDYYGRLVVAGVGLRKPAEQWLAITIGQADEPLNVVKCRKPETKWFQ